MLRDSNRSRDPRSHYDLDLPRPLETTRMTTIDRDKVSDEGGAQLTAFAQEFRGSLMLEALAGACAIISYADGQSSLIERRPCHGGLGEMRSPRCRRLHSTCEASNKADHKSAAGSGAFPSYVMGAGRREGEQQSW
jgi:hypothetical protein